MPNEPADDKLVREFEAALGRHGYGFQFAVIKEIDRLRNEENAGWEFVVSEFPVYVQGQGTRIDFILKYRSYRFYLLSECKRVNPDGIDSRVAGYGSVASQKDVAQAVRRSDVVIYPLGVDSRRHSLATGTTARPMNKPFLKRIAQESGGLALFAKNAQDLEGNLESVQRDLNHQYGISYVPITNGREDDWRKVEVRVHGRPGLTVRTRTGYSP